MSSLERVNWLNDPDFWKLEESEDDGKIDGWTVPSKPENLAGMWHVIHRNAYIADILKGGSNFTAELVNLAANFPCDKCGGHFREYLNKNNPTDFARDNPGDYPYLKWTWIFHNAVSARINEKLPENRKKRIMEWETCKLIYVPRSAIICRKGCASA